MSSESDKNSSPRWSKDFKKEIRAALQDTDATPIFLVGSKKVSALFQTGQARRAMERRFTEGPIEVINGHMSNDPRVLAVKKGIGAEGTALFPATVDDFGRTSGNGVTSNFYSSQHVNGFPMIPATWPVTDNSKLRAAQHLANSFVKPWHEKIFRSFVRHTFKGIVSVPLKWRKGSSTAVPEFTTSDSRKATLAREAMKDAEKAGRMMLSGDFEGAFVVYGIGGAYYAVYRAQSTDKVSLEEGAYVFKLRPVTDLQYAVSGGTKGERKNSSKSVEGLLDTNGNQISKDFARERRRTAQAIPGKLGFALMPIAQAARANLYKKFPFSFHTRSRTDLQAKLRKWDSTVAVDVSDHDILWFGFILDAWKDELLKLGYADWWVELFITSLKLPIYVSAPGPGQGGVLLGDWAEPNLNAGLSSGNPFTDLLGAGGMAPNYLITQVEHTAQEHIPFLERATDAEVDVFTSSYWSGELDFACKSKGDDALMLWKGKENVRRSTKLLELMKEVNESDDERRSVEINPYIKITYEHGAAYLGHLVLFDSSFELSKTVLTGNPLSMIRNMWSPEYTVNSHIKKRSGQKRPYPGLAWGDLSSNYGTCPIYGELKELVDKVYFDIYGSSYSAFRERLLFDDTKKLATDLSYQRVEVPEDLGWLTPVEKEVIASPEKLQYKYLPTDVRPEILALFSRGINEKIVHDYVLSVAGKNCIGTMVDTSIVR